MNRCRSAIAILAVVFAVLPGNRAYAFDLDMRWGHVTAYWRQINAVVMSIAEHNALDFDWLDKLQAMKPPEAKGKSAADVNAAISAFRAKLDRLNAPSKVAPAKVHPSHLASEGTVEAAFLDSGFLLDSLVLHIINSDPVRVVGQYYPGFEDAGGDADRTWGMVMLADARIASVIEELGF